MSTERELRARIRRAERCREGFLDERDMQLLALGHLGHFWDDEIRKFARRNLVKETVERYGVEPETVYALLGDAL